jgi:UDP-glucose 4-epimerase
MARVVVTGGAGFIGAHLVNRLVARGDDVVVVDNLNTGRRESLAVHIRLGRLEFVEADVRRFDALGAVFRACDVVYHLAAQSNVVGAMQNPDYSVTTNVLGTFNVLRAAAGAGVRRVVFTSSREVYGEPEVLPAHEEHPLLARSLYGASKLAGEAYCKAITSTHPVRADVLRLANVYGPGDRDRVIPRWIEAARQSRDLEVFGGDQVIDFVWIDTVIDALLFAADRGLSAPVNVGSGVGTRLLDVAERLLVVTGSKSAIVRRPRREYEVARFVADTTRMRALGLVPERDPLQHLAEMTTAHD